MSRSAPRLVLTRLLSLRAGVGGCALATASPVALENAVVLTGDPCPPRKAAGKNVQGAEPIRKPMGFQHRTRQSELVLLRERQGAQQVAGADRNVALGKALQKDLRARGILIEERCRGSEQQEVAIARLRAHRLLGLRQKPGMAIRIGEGSPEDLVPSGGHILLIAARHLFRLIAERENRLRRGMHEACKTVPLRLQANQRINDSGRSSLPGHEGHSSTPWRRGDA